MEAFVELQPFCGDYYCLVMSPCSEVPYLSDFGIRLGSLNDTEPKNETLDQDETENILHRGPYEVERRKAKPEFFKIPFESYLINGENINLTPDLCYLAITGYVPDDKRLAILGQPFIQNYYTVLDMETMEIGLAAHIGTDAKIQNQRFSSIGFLLGFIVTVVLSVILIGIAYYTFKYYKQRR